MSHEILRKASVPYSPMPLVTRRLPRPRNGRNRLAPTGLKRFKLQSASGHVLALNCADGNLTRLIRSFDALPGTWQTCWPTPTVTTYPPTIHYQIYRCCDALMDTMLRENPFHRYIEGLTERDGNEAACSAPCWKLNGCFVWASAGEQTSASRWCRPANQPSQLSSQLSSCLRVTLSGGKMSTWLCCITERPSTLTRQ